MRDIRLGDGLLSGHNRRVEEALAGYNVTMFAG